jgi:hypothetical protein
MILRHAAPLAALCLAAALASLPGGCAARRPPADAAQPTETPATLAGPRVEPSSGEILPVVNAYCPIEPDRAVSAAKIAPRPLTRTWRGQRIGFCCDTCPAAWDAMSDEDRSAALSNAIARENQRGLPPTTRP